jgi:drug/metabolite transporter (DMT)-like permease
VPAAVFALCSSVLWGVTDFVGGRLVRRHPVATISLLSHGSGFLALAAVVAVTGFHGRAFLLGLAAGAFGAVSLYTFYRAMSLGTMSIVSPLLSLGSVLAFALAVAGGERPSLLAVVGAFVAFGGALLASLGEHASGGDRRRALGWAFASPAALGFYLYLLARGANDGAGSISAVFGARAASSMLLLALALAVRSPLRVGLRAVATVVAIGASGSTALVLFGYASSRGMISIATILASLYPLVTVLLAYLVVGERLRGFQLAGVALALAGVGLVTAS